MINVVLAVALLATSADLATPWEQAYAGEDATGAHVLGLWKFDTEDGLDATGKLPKGALQHGRFVPEGKFAGALESFPGHPEDDRSHGLIVPHHPRLSPSGAFTLELWLKPKPEFAKREWAVVVDKKYAGHDDYQLGFSAADGQGQRRLILALGFGAESRNFLSDSAEFPADAWVHIAATYDGQGKVRFFKNGDSFGQAEAPGRGGVSAGSLPLSLGDRLGSNYPGFPGYLDEVRLTSGVREFGQLRLTTHWPRRAFVRHEAPPKWTVRVTNLRPQPIEGATLEVTPPGGNTTRLALPKLAPGASHDVEQSFDTTLRPDSYTIGAAATLPGDPPRRVSETAKVTIVPRPTPHLMPVVMWGIGGVKEVVDELPRLKKLGFTHCFGGEVDHHRIVTAQEPILVTKPENLPAAVEMLDTALVGDLRILASTWPGYFEPYLKQYIQVGPGGEPLKRRTITPNAPAVLAAFERAGESIALTYGEHPAFEGMCVNSEVRDDSEVSFTEWDLAAYRKRFGKDALYPDWARSKYPPHYSTLQDFPADRVVDADHPQLLFYRWWWGEGDGWNPAHSAVHRGLHRRSPRKDLWTLYDPAVRCPPLWGSGGDVDVLSQWTYTDPDPLRMSMPVDEMFAMADGRQPSAPVMKMTQLFWYRSTTAPAESSPREGELPARWADQDPNTSFISIHPLHLREAFWTKLARPIQGIMYHGWSSLVTTDGSHAYKYTHPQLQDELARLMHEVVEPLGPTLKQVPPVKSDIAFLESFTTFAFATRSAWGYAGGWQADVYQALQHARLQPEIIYESHVLRDGLDRYKILVLTDCDVLTRDVVDRVLAFQQSGRIVIGDERLCPAIKPDILLPVFTRTKDAAADKTSLLLLAEQIRAELKGKYQRVVDTSTPEVVPHRRRAGAAEYIFLVNDAREPGDYVGQYGRVMELGLPTAAEVTIRGDAQVVYDLVAHRPVAFRREGKSAIVPLSFGPGEGRLLMTLPRAIARVSVSGPKEVARGQSWSGRVIVKDKSNVGFDAVLPLELEIFDADGRRAEFSGHYGAVKGAMDLKLDIATNDQPGVWEVRVRELASGLKSSTYFRVKR